jgi:GNAT superfamily N-acetyltransferase
LHWRPICGQLIAMGNVLQLVHRLDCRPEIPAIEHVSLRHFAGPADIDVWLEIRRKAFARQKLGVRDWSRSDFESEFLAKPWWKPEALWFARSGDLAGSAGRDLGAGLDLGTVTLGWRGPADTGKPVIHWLAVLPRERRKGIARLLVRHIEQLVWDSGRREIYLETHAAWTEAAALYQALGYREV